MASTCGWSFTSLTLTARAARAGYRDHGAYRPADPRIPARGLRRARVFTSSSSSPGCASSSTSTCTASARRARPRACTRTTRRRAWTSANQALRTLSADLSITAAVDGVDLVHSHTWYANLAGHLAKILHGIPHVVTAHSLEPRRPWKAEQLGGGYRLSSWVEKTAYEAADAVIAVSAGMRDDVLDCYPALDPAQVQVVRNGIDSTAYHPVTEDDALRHYGVDPDRPLVVFVGRITRQKGVGHLIAAAHHIDPDAQLVLCAGAPDTPEIAEETTAGGVRARGRAARGDLDPEDAAAGRGPPAAQPRDGVRLPVGLRAAGHRQPRGDGVRHRGRGVRRRGHPRGRRRRRDRPAGALRRGRRVRPSGRGSRRRSTRCWPTRSGRGGWARPAGTGPSGSSRGPAWPSRRSRSTGRSNPDSKPRDKPGRYPGFS